MKGLLSWLVRAARPTDVGELPAVHQALQYGQGEQRQSSLTKKEAVHIQKTLIITGLFQEGTPLEKTEKLLATGALLPVLAGSEATASTAVWLDSGMPVSCFCGLLKPHVHPQNSQAEGTSTPLIQLAPPGTILAFFRFICSSVYSNRK